MRSDRRTPALLVLLATAATGLAAHAQHDVPVSQTRRQPAQPALAQQDPNAPFEPYLGVQRFNLEFEGGTVIDYVQAITSQPGVVANISLAPDARSVPMPPIRLTNVSVEVAVNAVESIVSDTGEPVLFSRTVDGNGSASLYIIQPRPRHLHRPEDARTQSFRVRNLFADQAQPVGVSADELLGAIETLLRLDDESAPPEVVLHRETGTLIMRGSQEQIEAVRELLTGLRDDVLDRRSSANVGGRRRKELERAAKLAEQRFHAARDRVEIAASHAEELRILSEAGSATQREVIEARSKVRDLELDVAAQEADLQALLDELANLPPDTGNADAPEDAEAPQSRVFRLNRSHADAALEGALAMCEAMNPPASVEPSAPGEPVAIIIQGTQNQLNAFERWLQASGALAN